MGRPQGHHKNKPTPHGVRLYRLYKHQDQTGFIGFMRTWPDGQAPEYYSTSIGLWQQIPLKHTIKQPITSLPINVRDKTAVRQTSGGGRSPNDNTIQRDTCR